MKRTALFLLLLAVFAVAHAAPRHGGAIPMPIFRCEGCGVSMDSYENQFILCEKCGEKVSAGVTREPNEFTEVRLLRKVNGKLEWENILNAVEVNVFNPDYVIYKAYKKGVSKNIPYAPSIHPLNVKGVNFLETGVGFTNRDAPLPTPSAHAESLHVKSWSIAEYSLSIEFATSSGALAETVRITRRDGRLVITTEPSPIEDGGKIGTLTPEEVQAGGVGCEKREEKK